MAGLVICLPSLGQAVPQWHISPSGINLSVGDAQPFQILDENAHELFGAVWRVNSSPLADLQLDSEGPVLHAKAAGSVQVTALLGGQVQQVEVRIWPSGELPSGTGKWSVKALGSNRKLLPAFPIEGSDVDVFSLEQDERNTYIRGFSPGGLQRSLWTMPESTRKVRIVCGDFLGNVLVAATRDDSYTLYVVGPDGALRWRRSFSGALKGHAVGRENLLYLLNQPADGSTGSIFGVEEITGAERFRLELPRSSGEDSGFLNAADGIHCGGGTAGLLPIRTSNLLINIDGEAYVAFTQHRRTITVDRCQPGLIVDRGELSLSVDDHLMLWRIQPNGTHSSHLVESTRLEGVADGKPFYVTLPTGEIIPDGLGGVLLSVRSAQVLPFEQEPAHTEDFIYRINPDGGIAFRFRLPLYTGLLHDAMLLGDKNTAFATRGDTVVKFDVIHGSEIWERSLPGSEAEVAYATAGGGVIVRTRGGASIALNNPVGK